MKNMNSGPKKIKFMLIFCLIGAVISIGITALVYSFTRNAAQTVGKETVPSIVAAKKLRATLADAHTNAMKAMTINEKLGGKFWTLYRKDLNDLHSQLIELSKNINYGDEERVPLYNIQSSISAYEYTVGGAVSNGAQVSVDQFMEANRLMQQKILPASTALNNVNLTKLESSYDNFNSSIDNLLSLVLFIGVAFLIILVIVQIALFKRTKRILNAGLVLATVLFLANIIYSSNALRTAKDSLNSAKQEYFTSLNSLWSARAEAYNANALESLYLLHNGTGIVQTADTINFNLSAERLCSDSKAASTGGEYQGLFNDALVSVSTLSERASTTAAINEWIKFVDIDKKIRNLEYDSKHSEAVTLYTGDNEGQSNYEFIKLDASLKDAIDFNQNSFNESMTEAYKTINVFPYITAVFLAAIAAACIFGFRARLSEYRV